jgi:hypothetical protein
MRRAATPVWRRLSPFVVLLLSFCLIRVVPVQQRLESICELFPLVVDRKPPTAANVTRIDTRTLTFN